MEFGDWTLVRVAFYFVYGCIEKCRHSSPVFLKPIEFEDLHRIQNLATDRPGVRVVPEIVEVSNHEDPMSHWRRVRRGSLIKNSLAGAQRSLIASLFRSSNHLLSSSSRGNSGVNRPTLKTVVDSSRPVFFRVSVSNSRRYARRMPDHEIPDHLLRISCLSYSHDDVALAND